MNTNTRTWIAYGLVCIAILAAAALGVVYPIPAPPTVPITQAPVATLAAGSHFGTLNASVLYAPKVYVATSLVVTGTTTLGANIIHSSSTLIPTDGCTITPTAKLQSLTPAGNVGCAMGACTSGMETILYNTANYNVVITDTGNGILAGNQTLGQYDALMLMCISSKWVQVSAASAN
jgi:hypothetical protein